MQVDECLIEVGLCMSVREKWMCGYVRIKEEWMRDCEGQEKKSRGGCMMVRYKCLC